MLNTGAGRNRLARSLLACAALAIGLTNRTAAQASDAKVRSVSYFLVDDVEFAIEVEFSCTTGCRGLWGSFALYGSPALGGFVNRMYLADSDSANGGTVRPHGWWGNFGTGYPPTRGLALRVELFRPKTPVDPANWLRDAESNVPGLPPDLNTRVRGRPASADEVVATADLLLDSLMATATARPRLGGKPGPDAMGSYFLELVEDARLPADVVVGTSGSNRLVEGTLELRGAQYLLTLKSVLPPQPSGARSRGPRPTAGPTPLAVDSGGYILQGSSITFASASPRRARPVRLTAGALVGDTVRLAAGTLRSAGGTAPASLSFRLISATGLQELATVNTHGLLPPGPPIVTELRPAQAPEGAKIRMAGARFRDITSVMFADRNAKFTVISDVELEAEVPGGFAAGTVVVTGKLGRSDTPGPNSTGAAPAFLVKPEITSFEPTSGCRGSEITVRGRNLRYVGEASVGSAAEIYRPRPVIIADTLLTMQTGPLSWGGPITLRARPALQVEPEWVASKDTFWTVVPPLVDKVEPDSGPIGSTVTVTGTNFAGATEVKFGDIAARFSVMDNEHVSAVVPPGVVSDRVSVITACGNSSEPWMWSPNDVGQQVFRNAPGTKIVLFTATGAAASAKKTVAKPDTSLPKAKQPPTPPADSSRGRGTNPPTGGTVDSTRPGRAACAAGCFNVGVSGANTASITGVAAVNADDGERFELLLRSGRDEGHYVSFARDPGGPPARLGSFRLVNLCGDPSDADWGQFGAEYVRDAYQEWGPVSFFSKSGTLTIDRMSNGRIAGRFSFTACGEPSPDGQPKQVRVQGTFDAPWTRR